MIISFKKNFIFIGNGKVASSSIRKALIKYDESTYERFPIQGLFSKNHVTPIFLKAILKKNFWDKSFKFMFVRNPFDWFLSSYLYQYKLNSEFFMRPLKNPFLIPHRLKTLLPYYQNSKRCFFDKKHVLDGFNRFKAVKGIPGAKSLTQSCYAFDIEGNLMVDFIGKYENLYSDFEKIKIKLNIDEVNLPYENSNKVRKTIKNICFTKEAVSTIVELWKNDFEAFDYSTKLPKKYKII